MEERSTRVAIFDIRGRLERILVPGRGGLAAWDGSDERGVPVNAGIHFIKALARDGTVRASRRVVIVH